MWLVLCERGDPSGPWARRGLAGRGLAPVELVVAEALSYAPLWVHRLAGDTVVSEVRLADGRTIASGEVKGVLNRLVAPPVGHLAGAAAGDRDYAAQELFALILSWLEAFECPVLNRATPQGLAGPWLERSEWCVLAERAGLPVAPYTAASSGPNGSNGFCPEEPPAIVLSVAGTVIGEAPDEVAEGTRRLAELAGVELLELEFLVEPGGDWAFSGASAMPDLIAGGEVLLDRLAEVLR
jgi:hypothetical protein